MMGTPVFDLLERMARLVAAEVNRYSGTMAASMVDAEKRGLLEAIETVVSSARQDGRREAYDTVIAAWNRKPGWYDFGQWLGSLRDACGQAKAAEAPAGEMERLRAEFAQLRAHCASTATLGPDGRYHRALMTDAEKREREELRAEVEALRATNGRLLEEVERLKAKLGSAEHIAKEANKLGVDYQGEIRELRAKLDQAGDVAALFNVLFDESGGTQLTHEGVAAEAIRVVRDLRAKLAEAEKRDDELQEHRGQLSRFIETTFGRYGDGWPEDAAIRILRSSSAEVARLDRELAESERQHHASDEEARMAKERVERLVAAERSTARELEEPRKRVLQLEVNADYLCTCRKTQPAQPETVTTAFDKLRPWKYNAVRELVASEDGDMLMRWEAKEAASIDQAAAVKAATDALRAELTARDRRIAELEAEVNRLLPAWNKACDKLRERDANAKAARELADRIAGLERAAENARRHISAGIRAQNYWMGEAMKLGWQGTRESEAAAIADIEANLHLDQPAPSAGESAKPDTWTCPKCGNTYARTPGPVRLCGDCAYLGTEEGKAP